MRARASCSVLSRSKIQTRRDGGNLASFTAELLAADERTDALVGQRSEEHTSELQSPCNLVCRLLLEKKKNTMREQLIRLSSEVGDLLLILDIICLTIYGDLIAHVIAAEAT